MYTSDQDNTRIAEMEKPLKKMLAIYTDLLNGMEDKTFKMTLSIITNDNVNVYRFLKDLKSNIKGQG